MKKLFIIAILFIFNNNAFAQYTISGKIKDSVTNNPIELVTVILKHELLTVQTTVSDSLGNFKLINIDPKTYNIGFSLTGYKLRIQNLKVNSDTLINVNLTSQNIELRNVTITSSRPLIERKIDRLVYNVTDNPALMGAAATDILRSTPLVSIDNDEINIIGKSGARVMVNGRLVNLSGQDLYNYLKTIPINTISKIEVITSPPAKYDAEGNSGLLNIVTSKQKSKTMYGNIGSVYQQNYYGSSEINGSINGSFKLIDFNAGLSYRKGKSRPSENSIIQYTNQDWYQTNIRNQDINRLNFNSAISFKINKANVLSLNYTGSFMDRLENAKARTDIYNKASVQDSFLLSTNIIDQQTDIHDFNIYYRSDLKEGKALEIAANYLLYDQAKDQELRGVNYFSDFTTTGETVNDRSTSPQNIHVFTATADYEQTFKKIKFNFGWKSSFIDIDNNFSYYRSIGSEFIIDNTRSNQFLYAENTQAAYTSSTFSIKRIEFKLGLRAENTHLEGNSVQYNQVNKTTYFKVFPSLYIQHALKNSNIISFSYGKRISRPGFSEYNPFRYYFNAYQYAEGNPSLQPSFSNNFELAYTMHQKYILTLFYQGVNNSFLQTPFIDPLTGLVNYTRRNVGKEGTAGVYAILPIKITEWWNANNVLTGFIRYENSIGPGGNNLRNNIVSATFQSNNLLYLNGKKTFIGSFDLKYKAPTRTYIFNASTVYTIDLGIKRMFLDKHLHVGINASDIFYTGNPTYNSIPNTISPIYSVIKADNRSFRISCTYELGLSKKAKRRDSNADELDRLN
ncbi:hypothetical protein HDC92_004489 [Pedobacter sp. AK017]|uniref:outer membrane beta-barrel family protein n=1 Tax=Pedobacter sp. AK017 TaxID=2723073 RepID=UPI00161BC5B5|nr:outer membrane beta-barrel family protein [Pedobacter sp. AK017]MBB5440785.1 hypothetical protein [Pedobacter sp. AK017]